MSFSLLNLLHAKNTSKTIFTLIAAALLLKIIVAIFTPLSSDFINMVHGIAFTKFYFSFRGPYTFSIYFLNLFYRVWLFLPISHPPVNKILGQFYFNPSLSAYMLVFLIKLPFIIFDVLLGLLLYKIIFLITKDSYKSVVGIFSWLFNPYIFLVVEASGVVDVIGTFFAVLSFFLLIKEKVSLSGVALAIGVIARFYPLIFLPFYIILLIKEKKVSKIVKFLLPFIVILIFALFPLIINYGYDKAIKLLLLMFIEYEEFLWFFGVPITSFTAPSQSLSLIIIAYILLLFRFYKGNFRLIENLNESLLITLLAFFALGRWNSYYTLWFIPFLTVDCIINHVKRIYPFSLLFLLFLFNGMIHYFAFPDIFFFMPVKNTPLYIISRALHLIKETLTPGELLRTFLRSIFAGLCAIYSILILLRKPAKPFHSNVLK
jgi:uncharacterized membrane protein